MGNCVTKSKRKEIPFKKMFQYNPIPQLKILIEADHEEVGPKLNYRLMKKQEILQEKNYRLKSDLIQLHIKVFNYFSGVIPKSSGLYEYKKHFDSIHTLFELFILKYHWIQQEKERFLTYIAKYLDDFSEKFQDDEEKDKILEEIQQNLEFEFNNLMESIKNFQEEKYQLILKEIILKKIIREYDKENRIEQDYEMKQKNINLPKSLKEEQIKLDLLQAKFEKKVSEKHMNIQALIIGHLEQYIELDQIQVEKNHFIFVVNGTSSMSSERFKQSISRIKNTIQLLMKLKNQNFQFSLFLFQKNQLNIIFENLSGEEVPTSLIPEYKQLEEIINLDDVISELLLKIEKYEKPIITLITQGDINLKDDQISELKDTLMTKQLLFFCFGVQNYILNLTSLNLIVNEINDRDSIQFGQQTTNFMNQIKENHDLSIQIEQLISRLIQVSKKSIEKRNKNLKLQKEAYTQIQKFHKQSMADKKREDNDLDLKEVRNQNEEKIKINKDRIKKLEEENLSFEKILPTLQKEISKLQIEVEEQKQKLTKNQGNKNDQKVFKIGAKNTDNLKDQLNDIQRYIDKIGELFNSERDIIQLYKKIKLNFKGKKQLYEQSMKQELDEETMITIMYKVFDKNKNTNFIEELKNHLSKEAEIEQKNINNNNDPYKIFNQSSSLLSKIFEDTNKKEVLLKIIQENSGNSERAEELFEKFGEYQQDENVCVSEFCNQLRTCFQQRRKKYFQQKFQEDKLMIQRDINTMIEYDIKFNITERYCTQYKIERESLKMVNNQ